MKWERAELDLEENIIGGRGKRNFGKINYKL